MLENKMVLDELDYVENKNYEDYIFEKLGGDKND